MKNKIEIFPDEILMDSTNIPAFDTLRMEGRIEKPIGVKIFKLSSFFVFLLVGLFLGRIFYLQIIQGENFSQRSKNNTLKTTFLPPERGIIYDRNGKEIAWNGPQFRIVGEKGDKDEILESFENWQEAENKKIEYLKNDQYDYIRIEPFSMRYYLKEPGLNHILGYIGLPTKEELEKNPNLLMTQLTGKEGVEKLYELSLAGTPGIKLFERDSQNKVVSENIQKSSVAGDKLNLTIDSRVQSQLNKIIKETSGAHGFTGGAGIIIDVQNGELLALTSSPEFDSNVLSSGKPKETIKSFFSDSKKPFLNRAISGIYTPGSIVKPLIALTALSEGTISPEKQILSTGSITIPNPYFPGKDSVFKDWKAHGWVDMRHALAVSSDVYFYEVGGGFENIKGVGISKIKEYAEKFGIEIKTGIELVGESVGTIPSPEMKAEKNPKDKIWRVGDTYNTSIGQGFFQMTPIRASIYASALANNGKLITPKLNRNDSTKIQSEINISDQYFKIVKEGMRMAVTEGTSQNLNVPYVKMAAKTGTAEVDYAKKYINSWVIGFFPYENPRYAFCILMERGPESSAVGASGTMRQLLDWMSIYTPEYFK